MKKFRIIFCLAVTVLLLTCMGVAANAADQVWADGTTVSGQTIYGSYDRENPYVIEVNGTVNVTGDLTVSGFVKVTGGGMLKRAFSTSYSEIFYVSGNGCLTLEDVTICGDNLGTDMGNAIYVNSGEVIINEGTKICCHNNSVASVADGGAIISNGGKITMNGGVVEGTYSKNYGSIYLDGNALFTMNGGIIRNNENYYVGLYGGGAFYVREATLTINGGNIVDNISGGKGGAIYCTSYGTVNLNGGVISGNTSSNVGDGIFYSSQQGADAAIYISGEPKIEDDIYLDNDYATKKTYITSVVKNPLTLTVETFTEGRAIAVGSDEYTLTEADLAKINLVVKSGTTCYAKLDKANNQIVMTATNPGYTQYYYISYYANGGVGTTTDNTAYKKGESAVIVQPNYTRNGYMFTGWNTKADGTGMILTPENSVLMNSDVALYAQWVKVQLHTHNDGIVFEDWTSNNSLPTAGGNYVLNENVILSTDWNVGGEVNLCLGGKILDLNSYKINVAKGATLNIYDCDRVTVRYYDSTNGLWVRKTEGTSEFSTTGGIITKGGSSAIVVNGGTLSLNDGNIVGNTGHVGGVWIQNGGTFTMTGGSVIGNMSDGDAGGVFNNASTFNLSGGYITQNYAANNGGGVFNVYEGAVFNMTGGVISDNTSAGASSGVANYEAAKMNMSDGVISGNSTTWAGGGIYNYNAELTFTGGIIENNTSTWGGGGVCNEGTMYISGAPVIRNNMVNGSVNNVYLIVSECPIVVTGEITSEPISIQVYPDDGALDSPFKFTASENTNYNDADDFICEIEGYEIKKKEDGQLYIVAERVLEAVWTGDTDGGYYMDSETKIGVIRFLFDANFGEEVVVEESGIKYINAKNLAEDVADSAFAGSSDKGTAVTFYGDITNITEDKADNTYYAVAYVVVDGETFWSAPVFCSPNFETLIEY